MTDVQLGFSASATAYGLFADHDLNDRIDSTELAELPAREAGSLLVKTTRFDSAPPDANDTSLKVSLPAAARLVAGLPDAKLVDLLAADPFADLPHGREQRNEFAQALLAEMGEDGVRHMLSHMNAIKDQPAAMHWCRSFARAEQNALRASISADAVPDLDPALAMDVDAAFSQLIDENQVVWIGGTHSRYDESVLIPMLARAKEQGVVYLAIEIPSDMQTELDAFVKDGIDIFPRDGRDYGRRALPELEFARAAHKAGLEVVAVDQPEADVFRPLASEGLLLDYLTWKDPQNMGQQNMQAMLRATQLRDTYIADQTAALAAKGKTLGVFGEAHTRVDTQPAPTARSLLESKHHVRSAALKLETPDAVERQGASTASAYKNWFGDTGPTRSFAYPSAKLAGLGFLDVTSELVDTGKPTLIPYASAPRDMVVFVSAKDNARANDAFNN